MASFGDRITGWGTEMPRDYAIEWASESATDWVFNFENVLESDPDILERTGMTMEQLEDAYLAAVVADDTGYYDVRYSGGSEELREWLVDITGYMTADEYDEKYGIVE